MPRHFSRRRDDGKRDATRSGSDEEDLDTHRRDPPLRRRGRKTADAATYRVTALASLQRDESSSSDDDVDVYADDEGAVATRQDVSPFIARSGDSVRPRTTLPDSSDALASHELQDHRKRSSIGSVFGCVCVFLLILVIGVFVSGIIFLQTRAGQDWALCDVTHITQCPPDNDTTLLLDGISGFFPFSFTFGHVRFVAPSGHSSYAQDVYVYVSPLAPFGALGSDGVLRISEVHVGKLNISMEQEFHPKQLPAWPNLPRAASVDRLAIDHMTLGL